MIYATGRRHWAFTLRKIRGFLIWSTYADISPHGYDHGDLLESQTTSTRYYILYIVIYEISIIYGNICMRAHQRRANIKILRVHFGTNSRQNIKIEKGTENSTGWYCQVCLITGQL